MSYLSARRAGRKREGANMYESNVHGRHSTEVNGFNGTPYLNDWYDTLSDPHAGRHEVYVVSLRKPSHYRPDSMKYVSDFPKGRDIVLVYPQTGEIVRWVSYKDGYGWDQHTPYEFPFTMSFTA